MVKRLVMYAILVYALGLLFSGITYLVLDFAPYFVAGMIVTTPIYGAVRKHTGKGQRIQNGVKKAGKGFTNLVKINKKSLTAYFVMFIVVYRTHDILAEILVESAVVGVTTLAVTFATWELARFTAKKAKKVQFLSFGEAVKGAF
jgi:hypothetical protein